ERILGRLATLVEELTGIEPSTIDIHLSFVEAGVDSLLLLQLSERIEELFAVKLQITQLLEELTTLDRLAAYLEREVPATRLSSLLSDAVREEVSAPATTADADRLLRADLVPAATMEATAEAPTGSRLEQIVARQLEMMSEQLQLLRAAGRTTSSSH